MELSHYPKYFLKKRIVIVSAPSDIKYVQSKGNSSKILAYATPISLWGDKLSL